MIPACTSDEVHCPPEQTEIVAGELRIVAAKTASAGNVYPVGGSSVSLQVSPFGVGRYHMTTNSAFVWDNANHRSVRKSDRVGRQSVERLTPGPGEEPVL